MHFSIGICSCPMDPIDSIGSIFSPNIQYGLNLSKCLTTRTCTFPSERVRVRWITSISTLLHIYTSGFPIESKNVRLESGRQYWTTLINLHLWVFQKAHSRKLIPNWTRNHMITYTNFTPIHVYPRLKTRLSIFQSRRHGYLIVLLHLQKIRQLPYNKLAVSPTISKETYDTRKRFKKLLPT